MDQKNVEKTAALLDKLHAQTTGQLPTDEMCLHAYKQRQ